MIEEGMMVEIVAADFKEKMIGLVGLVVERVVPPEDGEFGEEPVFRVEFLNNRLKLPENLPSYWPASDLAEVR